MPDMDRIYTAIMRAIRDANLRLPEDKRVEESREAVLLGDAAVLDSLGLINLLVTVEHEVEGEFRIAVDLIDDVDDLTNQNAAFKTVSTLAEQISILLQEAGHQG